MSKLPIICGDKFIVLRLNKDVENEAYGVYIHYYKENYICCQVIGGEQMILLFTTEREIKEYVRGYLRQTRWVESKIGGEH
jgi:hypothetical protein